MASSVVDLEFEMLALTLKLYNNYVVPRNVVQLVINSMINFVTDKLMLFIQHQLKLNLVDEPILNKVQATFGLIKQIMNKFKTEHNRFSLYEKKGYMLQPAEYEIGSRFTMQPRHNVSFKEEKAVLFYIPLKWSLRLLLEIPGIFELLKTYMNELQSEQVVISNFIQGQYWKEKSREFGSNKFVLPLFLYYDEFETGNALGSHAGTQKLGGVHIQIPCFPPHMASQLDNILLVLLFYANDRKYFGNQIFNVLIDELNVLNRDGLNINIANETYKIYFQLALVLGDNLGLNEILGFSDSFRSGKPCRICRATISEIQTLTSEDENLLRTVQSYDEDCNLRKPQETGVKEICIFHKVDGFHICNSITLDIMHDIFEGTANYTMTNILNDLIYKEKCFSLLYLNSELKTFPYNQLESSNAIQEIKREHIIRNKLKMSASEMICFTRYFSLLVGDKVNQYNRAWKLYIIFRKIISIITSPRIIEGHIGQLEILIPEFLLLYRSLYGELKYKFHNMTHIVRTLEKNGPLVNYWSMRFESKHRQHKLAAVSTNNRKNLLKTLCIKSQLRMAFLKTFKQFHIEDMIFHNTNNIDQLNRIIYFPNCENENIISTNQVTFRGIDYKINMILVVNIGDNDLLEFGQVLEIFVKENCIYLLIKIISSICFNEHYYAYNVSFTSTRILKNICELPDVHPCLLIQKNNSLFIATKYIL